MIRVPAYSRWRVPHPLGNVAGVVFVVAPLHLLYINTRLLPAHVRPPMWRRAVLVGMALFYGFFVTLSFRSLWSS